MTVTQPSGDDAAHGHPAAVVTFTAAAAPEAEAEIVPPPLREIAHGPLAVASTDSIRLSTSPNSPAPAILNRPVSPVALCPVVTVSGPIAVRSNLG